MGRTSKFSFPLPGRKQSKDNAYTNPPQVIGQSLSKAQRILGTGDLSAGSPTLEEFPKWKRPSSKSDRISISISESTGDNVSVTGSSSERWEHESSVQGKGQRLHSKASSTLLGKSYGDDGMTITTTASGRLRQEDSSSTLRSHYDRQKSPLAISQQTSASSARDLALRKGFPPVVQRSPLLQVDSLDPFTNHFSTNNAPTVNESVYHSGAHDKESRKKPTKLDLSRLFPMPRRSGSKSTDSDSLTHSPASGSTRSSLVPSESSRKKLSKSKSKESMQSQNLSVRSGQNSNRKSHHSTNSTLGQLYDHYEQMNDRPSRMDRISETSAFNRASKPQDDKDSFGQQHSSRLGGDAGASSKSPKSEAFSWKNVRSSMVSPRGEISSSASISSKATKTSQNTSRSAMSNSDLQMKSVLSLSSDSEGEDYGKAPVRSSAAIKSAKAWNGSSHVSKDSFRNSTESSGLSPRSYRSRDSVVTPRGSKYLSIPGKPVPPLSPASTVAKEDSIRSSSHRRKDSGQGAPREPQKENKSRKESVTLGRSSLQPTPPISPNSMEFRDVSEKNSRFMAVTKQEEALLEALRQKKARMREQIIEEHEIAKTPSPPRLPNKSLSKSSESSSVDTVHGNSVERERILLYLDTPLDDHQIDMAEPSPDLSDFLSFGSDDDSTPRGSWTISPSDFPRPDSMISPVSRQNKAPSKSKSPLTAARLSAVGFPGSFRPAPENNQKPKKRNTGVRFAEDPKPTNSEDFFMDDSETEGTYYR